MALTNFAGAVAVITGGASGIGLATATALHSKGAHVVLADIQEQKLQQAEEQIRQHTAAGATGDVVSMLTDVTNEQHVQALMHKAVEQFGRIDLVLTCAGVGHGGPIDTFTGEQMQAIMNINFMGTYHCVRAALPTMRQQQEGHFVFLSSAAGKQGAAFLTAYCATKWAVRGFSTALRIELHGTGIGVTTVYPSWVETPMIHQDPEIMELFHIHALQTADDVAREILQAVVEDKRDLTLIPNPEIALLVQLTRDDPDKAERLAGEHFQQQIAQITARQTQ
jgi:NAD(P)-dependent dehydrogenase (short-subunit alcohol dehydrogenase family)